jgi:AraC-like DNA-binding protein
MNREIHFNTVQAYNTFNNAATLHPLVSVVDLSKADARAGHKMSFGIYCVVLKKVKCGDIRYGNKHYDYQDGTLVFFAPGQMVEVISNEVYQPTGTTLAFHPDLLHHTALGKRMSEFGFFNYSTSEALHLSLKEKEIIVACFNKIAYEINQPIDKHSKTLIASNIELLLNYCTRFYDRQFFTRDHINKGIVEKLEDLLTAFYQSDRPLQAGLPSVSYCAAQLHLSANYFGDLIKKETGQSAQEYIQTKIIAVAKERIFEIDKSISEVAYALGFKYPQHFTRLFKQKTGITPNEYRNLN